MAPPRRGIYTLGNDAVYDWAVAFFRSVARNSGGMPVTVIPFDDRCDKLARLARKHGAEIWAPPLLDDLDALGARCRPTGHGRHLFRKFAAFHGPYDQFAFFDNDIVVRTDFEPLFDRIISDSDLIVDCHSAPNHVYRPGAFQEQRISGGARCFNSGFFMSSAGLAPLDELHTTMTKLLPNIGDLPGKGEQPFINYWAEETGLSVLAIDKVAPELSRETWAGQSLEKKYIGISPFLHWAGFNSGPSMPRVDVFLEYRCSNAFTRVGWRSKGRLVEGSAAIRRKAARGISRALRPIRRRRATG
jgi:hypothetical protein